MEMNGDLILDTADIITRSLEAGGVHCASTVTSMSTVSGSVTLQVRVCEVPSYSGPLGTLRSRVGVGTGGETHTQEGAGHSIHRGTSITSLTADSDSVWCGGDGHILHSCWCDYSPLTCVLSSK